jgi:Mn-dependent DtxR family transcriptional regulator
MGLMSELHRAGHTIVLVTHDPEIGRMAERRIELHHGRLTEVSVFPSVEQELIDNLLKAVWHAQEDMQAALVRLEVVPEFAPNRATFMLMAQEGLIRLDGDSLTFTSHGETRAKEVIRRHRLSERLFYETFELDKDLLDEHACKIEHSLSPEVTQKICTFLRHPLTCPHGSPIPRGVCCPNNR